MIYIKVYDHAAVCLQDKLNNFAFEHILAPLLIGALIICVFTVILFETARRLSEDSYWKKFLVIAILLGHLVFSYLAPEIILYYKYEEVLSSLLFIMVESLLSLITSAYRAGKKQ